MFGAGRGSFCAQVLQQLDAAHHLHPFNDNAALASKGTRILTRGEGVYVWDADGNKLLDAFAGLWCVNVGYGRVELAQAAARQMEQLAYYNSFFQCTTEPTVHLAAKLAELAPGDFNHAFFANSGSEANDTILRLVRHFWAVQGQPQKHIFIGRHDGYHGTTMGGASLGGCAGCIGKAGCRFRGSSTSRHPIILARVARWIHTTTVCSLRAGWKRRSCVGARHRGGLYR